MLSNFISSEIPRQTRYRQSKTYRELVMTYTSMERDKKPIVRRPEVLKKLNTESLHMIERGLLGDLPDRLKPSYGPVRGRSDELQLVSRPSGFLSSCLPVIPDSPSPVSEKHISVDISSDDETSSPVLKKSFSFREKFSRISFLSKHKEKHEKPKWKTIVEDEKNAELHGIPSAKSEQDTRADHEYKSNKRFWFFRNKELVEKKENHRPVFNRSKSFEFLPRAAEEEFEKEVKRKSLKNTLSYVFGSNDTMGDAWTSNESLEYISNVYYDNDDTICLKSIKEISSDSSKHNSSLSTATSASSGLVVNIFNRESVQNLLDEFDKAVDLFTENYLSDCEPYTRSNNKDEIKEKRKSSSFSTLPSPKVIQASKVSEVSEDFKNELSKMLSEKRASARSSVKSARRGSVTDWGVLEEEAAAVIQQTNHFESNKYRRAQKKPMNRVRRMSSTKYWITPEECAVYSREQRPPLVIPRITQYRTPRREPRIQQHVAHSYPEQESHEAASVKSSVRQYEQLHDWSPTSERSRAELDRSFSKANSDSPPFNRINKRFGGSTENLLLANLRRPNHLQLPASSSGDSLDVEVREKEPGYARSRKSRSMVAPKMRSPKPAPRMIPPAPIETSVLLEGPVKRTKFSESGKKSRKNWMDCYMTLTPTALVFYKDQKTYQATKRPRPPGTPPSPSAPRAELILPLLNAHITQCIQMHTRRYTRSLVLTVNYDQYLLQDETEEGAKRWLKCIQNVYYKLGPPNDEYAMTQYQSSNTDLESLGRTPPVSRHSHRSNQKATGGVSSNEDLSDSTELSIPKSHVKRRLRNFFAKRPTMDSLVKKGIYQEEPVFGRKLEEVCRKTSPRVPQFVLSCVEVIESSVENMCTDGLYRASGNLSQVQKIRLDVDQNNMAVLNNTTDIHVLTGSLKLFFRELKEPLIPCNIFDRVLAACSIKPREAKIKEFREIIHSLPEWNRDTLKFLLEHLLRVTQYSEQNRMHTANLAIVFGPTLLWAPAEQAHNIAIDCIQQNHVVEILLNEFNEIFAEDNNSKGRKKS